MFQGTGALAFDATFYLQQNPDVATAIANGTFQGNALDHFVQFGQFEIERNPNAFFDTEFYLLQNPDVVAAIADPNNASVTSAFQHFVEFGFAEGTVRAPSAEFAFFNPQTYLAQNPDLQAAFGDLEGTALNNRLFQHFVEFGVNENRPGTGVVVDTIELTTGIDTILGTAGNDVFTAVIGAPTDTTPPVGTTTLQTGDQINGGAGIDTLRVFASATNDEVPAPRLVNVERVEVTSNAGVTANLGLQNATGIQTLALVNSLGSVAVNGATAPLDLIFSNSSGNVNLSYAAGVAGTTFAQDVAIANATGGNISVSGATTFNLDVSGDNTLASLNGTGLTTVNIAGAGALAVTGALASTVTTVNASANTGGVDLDLSATGNVNVTGGAGDDRFFLGDSLGLKDTVNGGAGFDTVVVDANDYSAAADAAPFKNFTGVERVEFVGEGSTVLDGATFTNASISNLLFNNDGNATIDAAGAARTYEFGSDFGGNATFNMKGDMTTLNVSLLGDEGEGEDGGSVIGLLDVNLGTAAAATAVSTINIVSSGVGTDDDDVGNAILAVSARGGSTVVLTGDSNLFIGGFEADDSGADAGFTINASGLAGNLFISGSENGDALTLGSGDSVILFNGGDSGSIDGVVTPNIVDFDVITGFTAGAEGDVLAVSGDFEQSYAAVSADTQGLITSASTLLEAFELAAADIDGSGWTAFTYGTSTYVAFSDGVEGFGDTTEVIDDEPVVTEGADLLVQLNGVSVADLTQDNFGFSFVA